MSAGEDLLPCGWTAPNWPGDDWEDHCGDPDCDICHGDIPPERLALFLRWKAMQGRDILTLRHSFTASRFEPPPPPREEPAGEAGERGP